MSEFFFNAARKEIREKVRQMCDIVTENLTLSLNALHAGDKQLAKDAMQRDELVNNLQIEIEDKVIRFMATQQPVASTLREFVSVFKIVQSLERIGDYAIHIAKEAKRLAKDPYPGSLDLLEKIIGLGINMTKDSIAAYLDDDADFAASVAARDDIVDKDYKKFIKEVMLNLTKDPEHADVYVRLVSTANSVERFCDHTTNICEAVIFINKGLYVELNDKLEGTLDMADKNTV